MPFTLISGTFHVRGYSPDGDSIRFAPRDRALVAGLGGGTPRFNARGHVQLRIEGIDTLETYYSPPGGGGTYHQPLALAHAALDRVLAYTGIGNVEWDANRGVVVSADDGSDGYILARSVEKNGRPVAFVFAGGPPGDDGAAVPLDVPLLRQSYNYAALDEGLAYATYYEGLFHDLRGAMTDAVRRARADRRGVHALDVTTRGFTVTGMQALTGEHVIMPKLFRRLCEYVAAYGTGDGFKAALAASAEPVLDLTTNNFTHFDTFIDQQDGDPTVRLSRNPEDLVFDPVPARPADFFSAVLEARAVAAADGRPTLAAVGR